MSAEIGPDDFETPRQPRDEVFEMNSVFDWNDVHVPLSLGGRGDTPSQWKQISVFEPPGKRQNLQPGTYVTSFAREPSPKTSPKKSAEESMIIHENTYQLEPEVKFQPSLIEPTMRLILTAHLAGKEYDSQEAPVLCKFLADVIKDQAKKFNFTRYKFVTDVTIGEIRDQGVITASRCLWDTSRDNFASVTYRNSSLFAVAMLYAMYFE